MFAGQGQFKLLKPLTAIKLETCRMKLCGKRSDGLETVKFGRGVVAIVLLRERANFEML